MRPGNTKTPVTECVVCAWNSTRSVGRRAEPASRPETKCMSSAKYDCPDSDEKTKHVSLKSTHRWTGSQCNWRDTGKMWSLQDVIPSSSSSEKPSGGILGRLDFHLRHCRR